MALASGPIASLARPDPRAGILAAVTTGVLLPVWALILARRSHVTHASDHASEGA
jgi:hypothetical protein